MPDQNFAVNAQIGNLADPTSLAGAVTDKAIANGGIVYLTSQNNPLLTPPNISGFNTEAVSPDGNQVYAIDTAQNALVVVNTADLSQRQLFEDGFNGVTGLQGATGVAISPDGGYVYVSGSQGITVFQRNTATGDLTLMSSLGTSVANLQSHIVAGQASRAPTCSARWRSAPTAARSTSGRHRRHCALQLVDRRLGSPSRLRPEPRKASARSA